MKTIKQGARGAAVEDVQQRLHLLGFLGKNDIDGIFGERTALAVESFCREHNCGDQSAETPGEVTGKVWAALVDATYRLGDRTLYLRMPYFHGHDVLELQQALGALGFFCGTEDGIFGAHTEDALRKFQMNLGLPSDGIAGAYTFAAIHNLEHSWVGKEAHHKSGPLGFARAADVLEHNSLCLFGTDEFTCSVASRVSNLAFATNPSSKIVSAEMLSTTPGDDMLLVQIATSTGNDSTPTVVFVDDDTLSSRLSGALGVARTRAPQRARIVFPETTWEEAGFERSAQHFAITLLDALCIAL